MLLFAAIALLCLNINSVTAIRCDRSPEGFSANKSPADGRFRLKITGNPERYAPGEVYTCKHLVKKKIYTRTKCLISINRC